MKGISSYFIIKTCFWCIGKLKNEQKKEVGIGIFFENHSWCIPTSHDIISKGSEFTLPVHALLRLSQRPPTMRRTWRRPWTGWEPWGKRSLPWRPNGPTTAWQQPEQRKPPPWHETKQTRPSRCVFVCVSVHLIKSVNNCWIQNVSPVWLLRF